MQLRQISETVFDSFAASAKKAHFLQSSGWAKVAARRGYVTHLLGIFDGDDIVACALLLERKILYYSTFYCPRGPILDYADTALLSETIDLLKAYVKKHHGLYLRLDPDLIIRELNAEDASVKKSYPENIDLIDVLKVKGGKHRGLTTRFNEASLPRFTFRVDITPDEEVIKERMHKTTRKVLNTMTKDIKVRCNDFADFKHFYQTMADTAKRKAILLEPLDFYTTFYEGLHEVGMSDLYCAYVDTADLKKTYSKNIEEVKAKLADYRMKPSSKKIDNRIAGLEDHLRKLTATYEEIRDLPDEEIILSAIITAKFADKVWLVHGGNRDILKFLNANYYLYYYIMMDAKRQGYAVCDFYGSEGKVDKDSDLYGLYLFKARFGGDFDEFIGEFDFVLRPLANALIDRLLVSRRKLRLRRAIKKGA